MSGTMNNPLEESKYESLRQNTNASLVDEFMENINYADNMQTGRQHTLNSYYEEKKHELENENIDYYVSKNYTPNELGNKSINKDSDKETAFKVDSNILRLADRETPDEPSKYSFPDINFKLIRNNRLEPLNRDLFDEIDNINIDQTPSITMANENKLQPIKLAKIRSDNFNAVLSSDKLISIEDNKSFKDDVEDDFFEDQSLQQRNKFIEDIDFIQPQSIAATSPSKSLKIRKLKSRKLRRRMKSTKGKQKKTVVNLFNRKQGLV